MSDEKNLEVGVFGGGCFWCTEWAFKRMPGVSKTRVGFMGGHLDDPDYHRVCQKDTGHVEVNEVTFDPAEMDFRELCDRFFTIHDPTQVNRQGPDVGEQYRSVIFYMNEDQKRIAEEAKAAAQNDHEKPIATSIEPASTFWPAEEVHQDYFDKRGMRPPH